MTTKSFSGTVVFLCCYVWPNPRPISEPISAKLASPTKAGPAHLALLHPKKGPKKLGQPRKIAGGKTRKVSQVEPSRASGKGAYFVSPPLTSLYTSLTDSTKTLLQALIGCFRWRGVLQVHAFLLHFTPFQPEKSNSCFSVWFSWSYHFIFFYFIGTKHPHSHLTHLAGKRVFSSRRPAGSSAMLNLHYKSDVGLKDLNILQRSCSNRIE